MSVACPGFGFLSALPAAGGSYGHAGSWLAQNKTWGVMLWEFTSSACGLCTGPLVCRGRLVDSRFANRCVVYRPMLAGSTKLQDIRKKFLCTASPSAVTCLRILAAGRQCRTLVGKVAVRPRLGSGNVTACQKAEGSWFFTHLRTSDHDLLQAAATMFATISLHPLHENTSSLTPPCNFHKVFASGAPEHHVNAPCARARKASACYDSAANLRHWRRREPSGTLTVVVFL